MLDAKRILVYGVTGSGKTTFAAKVSACTGIPWHSVDDLTWEPNWVQVPLEIQRTHIAAICEGDAWILDTAYGTWLDIPLARADLILALDYPRWFSLARLLNRTIRRSFDKKPICNGNHESLRTMFSKDSIIVWHFASFRRKRERIRQWALQPGMPPVIAFRNPRHADAWLHGKR